MNGSNRPTTFKPGQSGNPKGRPKLPEELKKAIRMNKQLFQELLVQYLTYPKAKLGELAKDPKTKSLDMIVIMVILNAIKKGDQSRLDFLMNRIIGKVKDEVHHTGSLHGSIVEQIENNE